MAFDDIDEHEQGERVRAWLKKNGSSIALGVAVGLAAIYGWQYWQGSKTKANEAASTAIYELGELIEAKKTQEIEKKVAKINTDYPGTTSQVLAVLQIAQYQQSVGKSDQGIRYLTGLKPIDNPELDQLVSLRIAQLQAETGKHDEAKTRLQSLKDGVYSGPVNELLGDIAKLKGDHPAAKQAYEKALTAMDEASPLRQNLEMKMAELPAPAAAAGKQGG
jgi:predicted negative regulator of RcsB-dependent stress response